MNLRDRVRVHPMCVPPEVDDYTGIITELLPTWGDVRVRLCANNQEIRVYSGLVKKVEDI